MRGVFVASIVSTKRPVPKDIRDILDGWSQRSQILRAVHVTIGLAAIILTITVASRIIEPDTHDTIPILGINAYSFVAWLAAVSTGILTSLNIGTKSNGMRNAWRLLNEAKIRYENEDDFDVEKLIDAYKEGEKLIGDVEIKIS